MSAAGFFEAMASIANQSMNGIQPGDALVTAGKLTITAGQARAGIAALEAIPVADLKKVVEEHGASLADDFELGADFADAAGKVDVPYAGLAAFGFRILAIGAANNTQGSPNSPLPHIASGGRGSNPWTEENPPLDP